MALELPKCERRRILRVYLAISWLSRSLWVSTPGVGINFWPRLRVLRAAALKGLLLRLKTPFSGRAGGPVGRCCRRCLCACSRRWRLRALLPRLGDAAVAVAGGVAAGGAVGLGAAAAVAAVGCCASVQPVGEALGRLGYGEGAAAVHGGSGAAAAAAALACCAAAVVPACLQAACYGAWAVQE